LGLRDVPAEDLVFGRIHAVASKHFASQVQFADGIVVASPIYNGSIAGGVKALLDLLPENALVDKVVLPIATGGSAAHQLAIEYSFKPLLSALGARHVLTGVFATDQQVPLCSIDEILISADIGRRLADGIDQLVRALTPAADLAPQDAHPVWLAHWRTLGATTHADPRRVGAIDKGDI